MKSNNDASAVLGILLLVVFGYFFRAFWTKVVAPSWWFREELSLCQRGQELRQKIRDTASTDLVHKGQLEREEISLVRMLHIEQKKRYQYSFSVTSIASLLYLDYYNSTLKPGSSRHTLLGRQTERWLRNAKLAALADHMGLIGYYNFPLALGYAVEIFPTVFFIYATGKFHTSVAMLPPGYVSHKILAFTSKEGESLFCTGCMWWVLCAVAVRFGMRGFVCNV